MSTHLRRSIAVIATALLAVGAAGQARASLGLSGGTLDVDLAGDVDSTDPALAYMNTSWEIEYSTCLKLVNYPDAEAPKGSTLAPEAAAGLPRISNGGRTYDFTVSAGFTRFSSGQTVTAKSFADAFARIRSPRLESPAAQFISDVTAVHARGSHLVVTLSKAAPDFLARMAMPFFCAVPSGLGTPEGGALAPASAGPYYIASRIPNRSIVLKRNPYYQGPRPHNLDQVVYTVGNDQSATLLRVEKGETDYAAGGVPPTAYAELASKYGINKSRFFVRPLLGIQYFAFNTQRPIFKNNVALRRAINYAIDRHAMLIQAGYLSGKRADQILPPGLSAFRDADLYPLAGPNVAAARKLAAGHTRDGKVVLYTSNRGSAPAIAQVLQYDLKQIGLDVDTQIFATAVQLSKMGTRGEPFDIGSHSWSADYADPYDFVNVLLDGSRLQDAGNVDFSYFDDPAYVKRMGRASLLAGRARDVAYGTLDADIMRNAAPWAVRANMNNRIVVSGHVGCFVYNPIYAVDLAALCRK
ncbi:MAG TPA: ABC transporter substrate-binding protein [Gaiellaceae bacterium]|nr:ABC transporter substrate-binding protein [Gaiellaceae bacterium]